MSELAEKVGRAVFPEKPRRFFTFRWMTIFVAILFLWNVAMSFVLKPVPQPPRPWADWVNFWQVPLHSPVFLILYNTAVVIGFVVIYLTRSKARFYAVRAVFYGMLLGGVAGELLYFGQLHWHTMSR
jgi:hypothetical protein